MSGLGLTSVGHTVENKLSDDVISRVTDIIDRVDEVENLLEAAFTIAAEGTKQMGEGLLAVVAVIQTKVIEVRAGLATL